MLKPYFYSIQDKGLVVELERNFKTAKKAENAAKKRLKLYPNYKAIINKSIEGGHEKELKIIENPCKLPPVKNPKVSKLGRPIQPPTYRMRASANKRLKPAPRRKGQPREEGHKPPRAIFIKDTERGSIIGTQLTITYHRQGEYYRHVFNKNVMLIHPEGKHYLLIYDNAGRMTFKKQSGIHG